MIVTKRRGAPRLRRGVSERGGLGVRRARLAGHVLREWGGAHPDERDGHRVGAHTVARDAAGGVGGARTGDHPDRAALVEVSYSELMLERLRDPVLRGVEPALKQQRARRRLAWSHGIVVALLIIGVVVGIAGMLVVPDGAGGLSPGEIFVISVVESILAAYSAWGMFWGVPAAWRWWLGLSEKADRWFAAWPFARRLLPTVPLLLLFYLPLSIGAVYGVLGGAVYEYMKARRVARQDTSESAPSS